MITRKRTASPTRRTLALVLLIVAGSSAGCGDTRFNQKERLGKPDMVFDHDHARTEMDGHIVTPREGAIGGFSAAGAGGCGCN